MNNFSFEECAFYEHLTPGLLSFYPLPLCLDHQRQQSLPSNLQLVEPFFTTDSAFSVDLEGATCLLISAVAY